MKLISFILVLISILSFNLWAQNSIIKQAIDAYYQTQYKKSINILSEIEDRNSLSANDNKLYYLYLGLNYFALNEETKAEDFLKQCVKNNPYFVPSLSDFPPKIVEFYKSIRNQFPIISNLKIEKFKPYIENGKIVFHLNTDAHVTLRIQKKYGGKVVSLKKYCFKGENKIFWNGKNFEGNFIDGGIYFFNFDSEAKERFQTSFRVKIKKQAPYGDELHYVKREKIIKETASMWFLGIGMVELIPLLIIDHDDENTSLMGDFLTVWGPPAIGYLIGIFHGEIRADKLEKERDILNAKIRKTFYYKFLVLN